MGPESDDDSFSDRSVSNQGSGSRAPDDLSPRVSVSADHTSPAPADVSFVSPDKGAGGPTNPVSIPARSITGTERHEWKPDTQSGSVEAERKGGKKGESEGPPQIIKK